MAAVSAPARDLGVQGPRSNNESCHGLRASSPLRHLGGRTRVAAGCVGLFSPESSAQANHLLRKLAPDSKAGLIYVKRSGSSNCTRLEFEICSFREPAAVKGTEQ